MEIKHDICQRAKKTKDSFPLSNHRASCAFELVHCDLCLLFFNYSG